MKSKNPRTALLQVSVCLAFLGLVSVCIAFMPALVAINPVLIGITFLTLVVLAVAIGIYFACANFFSVRPRKVRSVVYNSASLEMAQDIAERWKAKPTGSKVSAWQKIENSSPVPFKGKPKIHRGRTESKITIRVTYDVVQTATLVCVIRAYPNNKIKLEYEWTGPGSALDLSSSEDFKLLNYLLESIEKEFRSRGAYCLGASIAARQQAQFRARGAAWSRGFQGVARAPVEHWPSPQDFAEDIQSPLSSFSDPDLANSIPELNSFGLPTVVSGAFASVFKLSNGSANFAVRCFNEKPTDQHERYQAISRFILQDDLSYTVDFHYLAEGINHNGSHYPILKMTWIEGVPLDSYLRRSLHDRSRLERLRVEFRIMLAQLRKNGIAHGDLQHGNILVEQDSVFLVDYDGMYVPELQGRQSNELGHRNYQHPNRQAHHFGPYLDNFSAWLIDTTLLCLIEDPSLWENFSAGDECLLFRQSDLVDPSNSPLFNVLRAHDSQEIRNASEHLLALLLMPVEQLPYLTGEPFDEDGQVISMKSEILES